MPSKKMTRMISAELMLQKRSNRKNPMVLMVKRVQQKVVTKKIKMEHLLEVMNLIQKSLNMKN